MRASCRLPVECQAPSKDRGLDKRSFHIRLVTMDDHARPTEENAVSQPRWSWSRVDRLVTGVVIAIALSSAAWQARHELFGTGRAAAGASPAVSFAADRSDYSRLIDDEHFHVQLGVAYGNSGMLDQAIFHQREALRVNPSSLSALTNLGYYLYLKGCLRNPPQRSNERWPLTLNRICSQQSPHDLTRERSRPLPATMSGGAGRIAGWHLVRPTLLVSRRSCSRTDPGSLCVTWGS